MNRKVLLTGLSFLATFLAGCGTEPTEPAQPICLSDGQTETIMAEAEDVLGRMHFAIDKADIQNGYIRTQPLTGAQAFEFWRTDNVGKFNTAEANLHTVRRIVEIEISSEQGKVCTNCVVTVERMSLPERETPSASRTSALFTRSSPSLQRLELNPSQQKDMTWIELGRDWRLEAEILNRLNARL